MFLIALLFVALCLAGDLKRKREDIPELTADTGSKFPKTDAVPEDIWQMVLVAGNFEFAPELALASPALNTSVSKIVYEFIMGKCKNSEMLDEAFILHLLPLFLQHLKTVRQETDLASIFSFFFKHATCHSYASKIFKAWKSLDLSTDSDLDLFAALQESVGFPQANPVPLYLQESPTSKQKNLYRFAYPTILLNCGAISDLIWADSFYVILSQEYMSQDVAIAELLVYYNSMKKFVASIWNDLPVSRQVKTLELISRTLVFCVTENQSAKFAKLSAITMKLVGSPIPHLTSSDLVVALRSMSETEFQDILLLSNRLSFFKVTGHAKRWSNFSGCECVKDLYASFDRTNRALLEKKFEMLDDYKTWGPSKLALLTFYVTVIDRAGKLKPEIARHIWNVPCLDGMFIFCQYILSDPQLLTESLQEHINNLSDISVIDWIKGHHLKFIAFKNIENLNEIIYKAATDELLQLAESYQPGQIPSPLDVNLVDPYVAHFLVKCIQDDPVLSMKHRTDALLQLLPSLKRFF